MAKLFDSLDKVLSKANQSSNTAKNSNTANPPPSQNINKTTKASKNPIASFFDKLISVVSGSIRSIFRIDTRTKAKTTDAKTKAYTKQ